MKALPKRLLNISLACFVLFYFAMTNFALWQPVESSPILIYSTNITNEYIKPGDMLEFSSVMSYTKRCSAYVERSVIDGKGKSVWAETTQSQLYDPIGEKKVITFKVKIPTLKIGDYSYKALLHLICDGKTWTATTPLIPFTIQE